MFWIFVLIFYIVAFIWIGYEIYTAPLMPPEYDDEYYELFKDDKESTLK